mgnify:CR=1 FL=1
MKLLIGLFIVSFVVSQEDLYKRFLEDVNKIAVSYPQGEHKYAKNVICTGEVKVDHFKINELEDRVEEYNIADEAREIIKSVVYSSVDIKTFNYVQDEYYDSVLYEFVGIARKLKGYVDIAFINIGVLGKLEIPYNIVEYENCKKFLFITTSCNKIQYKIPRGYTEKEINLAKLQLRSEGYEYLKNKLLNSKTILTEESHLLDYKFLAENTNLISEYNIYHDQFQQNYEKIIDSIKIKSFNNVDQNSVVGFIKLISEIENFEDEAELIEIYESKLNEICNNIIEKNIKDKTSDLYSDIIRFTFQREDILHFYEIELTHNEKTGKFFFYIKTLDAPISINEDFMAFKTSNQIRYDLEHSKNELLCMFEVLVASKTRNNVYINRKTNFAQRANVDETLRDAIKQAKKVIKKNIKSTHSEFQTLTGSDVEKLYLSTSLHDYNKVTKDGYLEYMESLVRQSGVIDINDVKEIVHAFKSSMDNNAGVWNAYHVAYNNKVASFVVSRNIDDTFNVFIVGIEHPIDNSNIGLAIQKQNLKNIDGDLLYNQSLYDDSEINKLFDFVNALAVKRIYQSFLN